MQKKSYQKYSNAKYVRFSKHHCVSEFILTNEYLWYLDKLSNVKQTNKAKTIKTNQKQKQTTKNHTHKTTHIKNTKPQKIQDN